jgi:hypothetical protein
MTTIPDPSPGRELVSRPQGVPPADKAYTAQKILPLGSTTAVARHAKLALASARLSAMPMDAIRRYARLE